MYASIVKVTPKEGFSPIGVDLDLEFVLTKSLPIQA